MFGWHRLIKATHQLQIHSRSSAPASNTARDRDAAVQGALPQSLTPVMPHPGLLLTHPTAEPSPVRGSAPSSSPAVASYPESTLPLPPVLKAHQTSRHRRRTPPLTVSPQAHNPLHSPLLGQAGADELLSLARQYGACIDRREPKRPKQELSAKKSDGAHRPVSAIFSASYCFLLLLLLACMRTASPLLQADRNTLEQTYRPTATPWNKPCVLLQSMTSVTVDLLWLLTQNSCKLSVQYTGIHNLQHQGYGRTDAIKSANI